LKALKLCQLALGRALAENRKLRQNNSNLLAVQGSKRRGRGSKDTSAFQSVVGPLAKRFFLTQETWVRVHEFKKAPPEPPLTIEQRFANTNNYSFGVTAALHAIVPEKLRPYLDADESTDFPRAVSDCLQLHAFVKSVHTVHSGAWSCPLKLDKYYSPSHANNPEPRRAYSGRQLAAGCSRRSEH
jgi:hypothetical protein